MSSNYSVRRRLAISFGVLGLFAALAPLPASAQVAYWWAPSPGYGYMPPLPIYRPAPRYMPAPVYPGDDYEPAPRARPLASGEISRLLRARGMQVSRAPTRNGGVYVADVRDPAGNPRRVIVDGYYGRVLQTFPASALRQPGPPQGPRYAGRPAYPEVDIDSVAPGPGGPNVIPGIGPDREIAPPSQRPRAGAVKKKPAKKVAARPAIARPALPVAPPAMTPQVDAPLPAAPPAQNVSPQPAPVAVAPPPEQSAPATPGMAPAPATGEAPPDISPAQKAPEPSAKAQEPAPERPRRRVRFLKPDANGASAPSGEIALTPSEPAAPVMAPAAAARPAAVPVAAPPANPLPPVPPSPLE